ncbi:chlorophyll synthase ChlG [Erythrobacter sp. LQ02-29]|uniref:chlorophyll synthase ChlG n=1 Tax=Erythrobacter sp. LQ02-29 TaxID=2920384 RepID=UPI001F4E543D|nr:chlorophyll synthase ChlG [Erythrobacter sp. LQ02-29]MCP9223827.1 chlorophyll synthase ChlG [Erythrobacter sp. LQ02-29]
MAQTRLPSHPDVAYPGAAAALELIKPITWFAPVWALLCGSVAAGGSASSSYPWLAVLGGAILAGPLVCGGSQAANDWFDRDVDAINQPDRPVPSGRVPGRWALWIAIGMAIAALLFGLGLGRGVFVATVLALALGWSYSAPPFRFKTEGWLGAAVTGVAYEGLAWLTGALIVGGEAVLSRPLMVPFAALYSLGALGIMVLNDFKAVEGDRQMGVNSLPVRLGVRRAALTACAVMAVPQMVVVALLALAGHPISAALIGALVIGQFALMRRLLRDPQRFAPWYNGTGVTLFVAGMMVAAVALRHGAGG